MGKYGCVSSGEFPEVENSRIEHGSSFKARVGYKACANIGFTNATGNSGHLTVSGPGQAFALLRIVQKGRTCARAVKALQRIIPVICRFLADEKRKNIIFVC